MKYQTISLQDVGMGSIIEQIQIFLHQNPNTNIHAAHLFCYDSPQPLPTSESSEADIIGNGFYLVVSHRRDPHCGYQTPNGQYKSLEGLAHEVAYNQVPLFPTREAARSFELPEGSKYYGLVVGQITIWQNGKFEVDMGEPFPNKDQE